MATGKSTTTTRKPSTTRAAASTSTGKSDADPVEAPAPEPSDAEAAEQPAAVDESAGDDPAAALKKKIRTTQHIENPRPDELTDEQRLNLVGAPAGSLPGPRTLASGTSPTRTADEYVLAEGEGHIAFVPKNLKQPATVRVWVEGQKVRKDMLEALSGFAAPTALKARVLSADEYAQVAPYL